MALTKGCTVGGASILFRVTGRLPEGVSAMAARTCCTAQVGWLGPNRVVGSRASFRL